MSKAEADILVAIQQRLFDAPLVLPFARGMSFFGEHAAGWMGSGLVLAAVDRPRRGQWLGLSAAAFSSHAASVIIKRIVRRRRPHDERILIGVGTPSRLSFPSSHSTSTTAALAYAAHVTGSPAPLVGVPLMMASRLVLGVHYPTDVAAGAALGWLSAELVDTLLEDKLKEIV
ncbi:MULTISPECIES: phosphatase PAP2 family protein [Corynebacterium]|uniref:phosphatase PAP2 family protein n=1 Tax=Corynebacterium TaxID=1716 RepID=UPI00124C4201|nr:MULTISPECIES: phosphatase PAP2 family protein [Corynebacterium]